jgi:hypothetical protein
MTDHMQELELANKNITDLIKELELAEEKERKLAKELECISEMVSLSILKPEEIFKVASPEAKKIYLDDMRSRVEKYPVSTLFKFRCNPKTPPEIRDIVEERFVKLFADKNNLPMLKDSLFSFGQEYLHKLEEKNPEGYAQYGEQFKEVLGLES